MALFFGIPSKFCYFCNKIMMQMKKTFQSIFFTVAVASAALYTTSCTQKKFHVNGNITQAKDSILYFENIGLNGTTVLDSVRLGQDGAFAFAEKANEAPEFYRLRIAGQIINVSIDSTETVNVKAAYPAMASQYEISGSENCAKIKELTLMQMALQQQIRSISENLNLASAVINDSLEKVLTAYKNRVKIDYIFKEPMKAYAYFALFQTIDVGNSNILIFNPRANEDDIKVFAAVATSWDTYYPKAERGANLHNIAIEGMKDVRIIRNNRQRMVQASQAQVSGIIDIALPDNQGRIRNLSDTKGKVVMLDFHLFDAKESTQRIMMLRELYNKYHSQGFEIFQVSVDSDEHFWKTKTAALPWISVHADPDTQQQVLIDYNVQNVPTFFLIDKNNVLQKRDLQIKDIDAEIKSLL